MSGSSLLSKISRSEREFIAHTAEKAVADASARTLDEKLIAIARVFSEKSCGCGESVLAGGLARPPSQVKNQRYCGEEAIKNELLLAHLGIHSIPIFTTNFQSSGQEHDTILVQTPRRDYILDWGELIEVRRNGSNLLKAQDRKLLASSFTPLSPELLLAEINKFTGVKLIDAFANRHLIKRTDYSSGNIESSVHFNRADKKITIGQLVTDVTTNIPFYSDTTIIAQTRGFVVIKSAGLAPTREGILCTKIPLFHSMDGISVDEDFKNRLSEAEREAFVLGMAYTIYSQNGKKRVCSKGEVQEFLGFLEETSKKHPNTVARNEAQGHLDYYRTLNEAYGFKKSERFLESLNFKIAFRTEHPSPERALFSSSPYKSFRDLGKAFIDRGTAILKEHYFTGTRNTPEQILVDHFGYQFKQRPNLSRLALN
ncbi:MAG: hypothetical protein AABW82_00280 [Nanoarchaeota archaeon]